MNDLISREQLLRSLYEDVKCMNTRFLNCVRFAPAVNRWIPCSERLPEKHVEVLAYSPYWGKIVVAMFGGEFWLEQWTDDDLEQSEVSHWMPLPEPPEKECNDDT